MISCKEYVATRKATIKRTIEKLGVTPSLDIYQIGDNPASNSYIKGKLADCAEVGIVANLIKLPEDVTQDNLEVALIRSRADGVILQLPVPSHINSTEAMMCIAPWQDVDGFRADSPYTPCTPKGIMDWLEFNNIDLMGKNVVIIGRSDIVGKPLAELMLKADATVTLCHSKTPKEDMIMHCECADIVVCAVGKPRWLEFDAKPNAIVVDVGINRDENGKLCGDVKEARGAAYVTPVPGSVGLTTRLALIDNITKTYE